MRKRIGALTALPLVIGLIASMTLAGTVTAAPSAGVTITQTAPCTFSVWYYWGGMGHGNDLTARVAISAVDAGGSSTVGTFSEPHKSGRDGILSHEFHITGQQYPFQFRAWAELSIPSKSQVIAKSSVQSPNMLPFAPVTCA